jgi:hypothetical protein
MGGRIQKFRVKPHSIYKIRFYLDNLSDAEQYQAHSLIVPLLGHGCRRITVTP